VDSSFDYLNFKEFLSPQEEELRKTLRAFLEAEIAPTINDYYEKAEFPYALVKKLKALNIFKYFLPKPYGEEVSNVCKGVLIAELARIDLGFGTFVLLCWGLVMITLLKLGSKEQIAEYIPKLRDLEIIGGWGLTEEKIGSDASNIETSVKKVEGGYILNGNKRWIGNGNKDILLVFAKNQENGKVETFILDMKTKGVTT
jgi:acyl-CoA oxidase